MIEGINQIYWHHQFLHILYVQLNEYCTRNMQKVTHFNFFYDDIFTGRRHVSSHRAASRSLFFSYLVADELWNQCRRSVTVHLATCVSALSDCCFVCGSHWYIPGIVATGDLPVVGSALLDQLTWFQASGTALNRGLKPDHKQASWDVGLITE